MSEATREVPTWEADVLDLLRDVAEHFAGTDSPLGARARLLFYTHVLQAAS